MTRPAGSCATSTSPFWADRPISSTSYQHGIRAEYAWVPDEAYREGRARVLAELLRRESLFQTDSFRDRFGSTARANLRRALDGLAAKG